MSLLLNGDCLEQLLQIDDDSIDFIFCDLPYGQTSCKWDIIIPWEPFWKEIMRVKKLHTPVFFTTTTKFGVELINSSPKKMPFRYDLVWVKTTCAGFLSAKKMPMRKHEMVYCFYEKLPFYDLSSHQHKFLKPNTPMPSKPDVYGRMWDKDGKPYVKEKQHSEYNPPLPVSVVKEDIRKDKHTTAYGDNIHHHNNQQRNGESIYDPPLPNTMLEIKSTRGNHSTEKPVALMEWLLKYYSKEGDTVLDPTMGSGSTGVACKNMNRNFIGIEKDPEIYDIAVNRIESN